MGNVRAYAQQAEVLQVADTRVRAAAVLAEVLQVADTRVQVYAVEAEVLARPRLLRFSSESEFTVTLPVAEPVDGSTAWSSDGALTVAPVVSAAGSVAWSSDGVLEVSGAEIDRVASLAFSSDGALSVEGRSLISSSVDWESDGHWEVRGTIAEFEWRFLVPIWLDSEDWRWHSWHRLSGGRRVGLTLLRIDGEYVLTRYPTPDTVARADRVYIGGRVNVLSGRAEKDELEAAGYDVEEVEI